jgi:hypothetical protein
LKDTYQVHQKRCKLLIIKQLLEKNFLENALKKRNFMKDFSPQMSPSLGILFFAKKTKSLQNGQIPVYLRITVNGERVEVATKRTIPMDKWIPKQQRYRGNSEEARLFNTFIDSLRNQVFRIYRDLCDSKSLLSALAIKNELQGTTANAMTLRWKKR